MNSSKKKNILYNFILVVFSVLITLLLVELILRQLYPVNTGSSYQFRIPHQVYGWVLEPGADYYNQMDEATVHVTYNSKGWRDTEHDYENPGDKFRILILGDSFMEAYSVGINDALPKKLEKLVDESGLNSEVLNLAVGGYGTLQQYLVFSEIGKQYQPDVVLLGFYLGNDVVNNSLALESLVSPGSMKVQSRPFVDTSDLSQWKISVADYEGAQSRYLSARQAQNTLRNRLEQKSVLVRLLLEAIKNIETAAEVPTGGKHSMSDNRYMAFYGVNYCDEPPEFTEAWGITKTILARLRDEITDTGSKFVVFTVPAINEVDPGEMKKTIDETPENHSLCLEDPSGYRRLSGILNELNIEHVDLLPGFRNATIEGNMNLFRRSDRHWNEQGHHLAANILHAALMETNTLKQIEMPASDDSFR